MGGAGGGAITAAVWPLTIDCGRGVLQTLDGGAPLDDVVALIVGYARKVAAA